MAEASSTVMPSLGNRRDSSRAKGISAEDRLEPAAAYVGEMSLMASIGAIVSAPRIYARVHFLAPIETAGRTRRELAQLSHARIAAVLSLPCADN